MSPRAAVSFKIRCLLRYFLYSSHSWEIRNGLVFLENNGALWKKKLYVVKLVSRINSLLDLFFITLNWSCFCKSFVRVLVVIFVVTCQYLSLAAVCSKAQYRHLWSMMLLTVVLLCDIPPGQTRRSRPTPSPSSTRFS